ncbi:hypothetical protein [Streptomyces sp. NPDC048142]|uniref:hypothetical protein n=1 Tax=Streptomyces sp. NPDC048142 TaxID=3365501 RepID=UPI0037100DB2
MLAAAGLNTATIAELLLCMVGEGRILEPACSSMLPDLHRERARIDESAAALLAARHRAGRADRAHGRVGRDRRGGGVRGGGAKGAS